MFRTRLQLAFSQLSAKICSTIPRQKGLMWDSWAILPRITATRGIGCGVRVRWGGTLSFRCFDGHQRIEREALLCRGARRLQGRGRAGSWSAGVEEPSEVWWGPEWQEHWYQHPASTGGVRMGGFSVCNQAGMGGIGWGAVLGILPTLLCASALGPRGSQAPSSDGSAC